MHMALLSPNLTMDLLDPDLNRNWYPWSPTPAASYLATPIMPNLSHAMSRSRTTDTITIAHSTTVPDPPCPIAIVATGSTDPAWPYSLSFHSLSEQIELGTIE